MDIALRKDLIEIQELIANPPPKAAHNAHKSSNHSQRPESRARLHQNQNHHHHQHHHQRKSMTNLIWTETDEHMRRRGLSSSSINVQQQQQQCAVAGQLLGAEAARGTHEHLQVRASLRDFHNLDAPSRRKSADQRLAPAGEQTTKDACAWQDHEGRVRPAASRLRTRTLAAGLGVSQSALAELIESGRQQQPLQPRPRPNSVGSVRTRRSLDDDRADECDKLPALDEQPVRAGRLRPCRLRSSPTGSMRSSRVGARGLRPNRGLIAAAPRRLSLALVSSGAKAADQTSHTDSKPNANGQRRSASQVSILGSSRLSLVQLRKMVRRRAASKRATTGEAKTPQETAPESSGQATGSNADHKSSQQADMAERGNGIERARAKPREVSPEQRRPPATGRRQERLERELQQTEDGQMRAPNGIKLLATKPLAPLDDDTQLYAIPKKSSKVSDDDDSPAHFDQFHTRLRAGRKSADKRRRCDVNA